MRLLSLLAFVVLLAACSAPSKACRVGADCASGLCLSNGTCAVTDDVIEEEDGGAADGSVSADGGRGDGGGGGGNDAGWDGGTSLTCVPNNDGIITAAELPIRAGLRATYRTAEDVTVNTAGVPDGDGGRVWDFAGALTGDSTALWETESTTTAWYSTDFPSASYAARLSVTNQLRGVFETKSDGLYLLGVVSPTSTYPSTKLSYSPAVKVFALPLSEGTSWSTSTTVSGTYIGAATYYTESYTSQVDSHGTAKTPFGDFPVLRVRTVLVKSGNAFTTTRTFAYAAECFSAVAQVVSRAGESSVEFTSASEVRRLSP